MPAPVFFIQKEMQMKEDKRFFTITELSEYLSLSKNTIYGWVNQQKIPYVKLGGALRFDKKDIDKMIEENKVERHKIWGS